MSSRLAAAAIVGCAATVLAYALLRVVQRVGGAEPDPALVFFSPHASLFWRAWIAAFAGGMAAIAAWLGGGSDGARAARLAVTLVPLAAAALAVTALLAP